MRNATGALRLPQGENEVVVCAYARSPFGRFHGALRRWSPERLGATVIDGMLERTAIAPERIDAVYAGIGLAGAAKLTVTRQMVLRSRLPQATPSMGIDRACCSGMTAIAAAAKDIALGLTDTAVAGGMEVLSGMPIYLPRDHGVRPGSVQLIDPLILRGDIVEQPIASYSGAEALRYGIDREQQDAWALRSHQRAIAARERGDLAPEILAIDSESLGQNTSFRVDEGPRQDTSLAKLASLNTVYGSPTITPGNAPGLSDGAAFIVLASARRARQEGWPVLGRLVAYAQVADGPTSGTSTPALALERILQAADCQVGELDRIEINEAYAATPLVSTQVLADKAGGDLMQLRERTNPWGGAVALGHPLGASGARLVMTLLAGFARNPTQKMAAAAICGGFGQGDAVLLAAP